MKGEEEDFDFGDDDEGKYSRQNSFPKSQRNLNDRPISNDEADASAGVAHDESPRATSKADGGSLLDEHERAATEMDKSRPSVNQSDGPPTSVGSGVDGCTSSGNLSCTPSVASPGESGRLGTGASSGVSCDAPATSDGMMSVPKDEQKGWPSKRLPPNTRFFIMKSFSERDVKLSMQKGIWATQQRNESKLNAAYQEADAVILFFSVNESRAWQGYAKMASRTGESAQVWTAVDGTQSWGGVFKVKWQTIYDLSFQNAMHLSNPYNENKPIKISRDGQEVEPSVGFAMSRLFDEGYVANPSRSMKRRKLEDMAEGPPSKGGGRGKGGYTSGGHGGNGYDGYQSNNRYGNHGGDHQGRGGSRTQGNGFWRGNGSHGGGSKGWYGDGKGKGGGRSNEYGYGAMGHDGSRFKRPREDAEAFEFNSMPYDEYSYRQKRSAHGEEMYGNRWDGGYGWDGGNGGNGWGGPMCGHYAGNSNGYGGRYNGYGGYGEQMMHSNFRNGNGWR